MKLKLLKRWTNMLFGKSSFHVNQGAGRCYSKTKIKGYYNDLTNKVSDSIILDENQIPVNTTIANVKAHFPITIFQYGLGLYDYYLLKKDKTYLKSFLNIAMWALKNQNRNGMWNCMATLADKAHQTQSSMCQSEGASVLLRAYIETQDRKYYNAAKKAIDFMLMPIDKGGTCSFDDNDRPVFQEYVSDYNLSVLNGWIFSIFGLYDFTLVCPDSKYKNILNDSVCAMSDVLQKYDRGFWSNYDLKGTIASPAYHNLHIEQLKVLYHLFGVESFINYANKWEKDEKSVIKKNLAMLVKLKQKILKSKYYDINTSLVN